MIYYPPVTRISPLATLRRERLLPVEGEVLVRMGARVDATDVVARAQVPERYHILDIAEALRASPEVVDRFIRVRPGQAVKAGQAIAGRRISLGLVPLVARVPQDSIVEAAGGGRVLLRSLGEPIEVRAHLPGIVSNVMPKVGALIETVGALIQGVWGSGDEAFGVLKVLVDGPDQPLRARSIDVASHGAVLVGGSTMDRAALQQALELQVRGIVIGSLDPTLVEMVKGLPFPVITTEGLGQASMARPIFQLLSTNDGREAAISGHTQPRWGAVRPEVIIPLPTKSAPALPPLGASLEVGAQVRVIRGPAMGAVGRVRHLPAYPLALETEATVWGAVVALEKGDEQFVPLYNLELLA
jgi:hypothetical protein